MEISNELLREENINLQRELSSREDAYRTLQSSFSTQEIENGKVRREFFEREQRLEEQIKRSAQLLASIEANAAAEVFSHDLNHHQQL